MPKALRQLSAGKLDRWHGLSRPDVVPRDLMAGRIPARRREAMLEIFQTELPRDEGALLGQVRRNLLPGNRTCDDDRGILPAIGFVRIAVAHACIHGQPFW